MEVDEDGAFKIKIILIGDAGVGKTSLINVSTGKEFNEEYNRTINGYYRLKKIVIDNKRYNLYLWDTIGQEEMKSLTRIFFKNSKIVILVFDITEKCSFEGCEYWLKEVKENLPDETIMGICGNKSDLFQEEKVTKEEFKEYAEKLNIQKAYTSAKDDPISFDNFLIKLVREYINADEKENKRKKTKTENKKILLNEDKGKKNKEKKHCC